MNNGRAAALSLVLVIICKAAPGSSAAPAVLKLAVSVRTEDSGYVRGLTASNLEITVGDRPCLITNISNSDEPITVGFIFDSSGSMRQWYPPGFVERVVTQFIQASHPANRYFAAEVNDAPMIIQDFTADPSQILKAIPTRFRGATDFYTALRTALRFVEGLPGKKALLLFTDGEHNIGQVDIGVIQQLVSADNTQLYSFAKSLLMQQPESRDTNWNTRGSLNRDFRELLRGSGGDVVLSERKDVTATELKNLVSELRHQALIECRVDVSKAGWKKVKVRLLNAGNLKKPRIHSRDRIYIRP